MAEPSALRPRWERPPGSVGEWQETREDRRSCHSSEMIFGAMLILAAFEIRRKQDHGVRLGTESDEHL